jgi:hypothetical protein
VQECGGVGAAYLDAGGVGQQAERGHRVASAPNRLDRRGTVRWSGSA